MSISEPLNPALSALWSDYFGPTWVKTLYSLSIAVCMGPGLYVLSFVVWYGWDVR